MKKKKNLLLVLAAMVSFSSLMPTVRAEELDTTKCEGEVYTNYYYLLAANTLDRRTTNTNETLRTLGITVGNNGTANGKQQNGGIYNNNIIIPESVRSKGLLNNSDIERVSGVINVNKNDTTSSNGHYTNIKLEDFYTKFKTGLAKNNGSWSEGNVSYIVYHGYNTQKEDLTTGELAITDGTGGVSIANIDTEKLVNASVILPKDKVNGATNYPIEVTVSEQTPYVEGKFSLSIVRDYNQNAQAVKTQSDGRFQGAIDTVKFEGDTKSIVDLDGGGTETNVGRYLQPAVYYIQYCVKKTDTKTNTRQVIYKSSDGKTTYGDPVSLEDGVKEFNAGNGITAPTLDGYTLSGWSKTVNATERDYRQEGSVKIADLTPTTKNNIETYYLYAVWTKNDEPTPEPTKTEFTVEYDPNGGSDAPAKQVGTKSSDGNNTCVKISDGSTLKHSDSTVKFLGWNTNKTATKAEDKYKPGTEYCGEDGNLVLYAIWENPASPKLGVGAGIVGFIMIASAAGAGIYIAKHKNLLKQI